MKLSVLIMQLRCIQTEEGDLEVYHFNGDERYSRLDIRQPRIIDPPKHSLYSKRSPKGGVYLWKEDFSDGHVPKKRFVIL